jgi:replicative DNA helicase
MIGDRIPPHAPDLEAHVLSALLQDPTAAAGLTATLEPVDFFGDVASHIFAAASRCARRGLVCDVPTVGEELHRQGRLGLGGVSVAFLAALVDAPPSPNWAHHARILREKSERRAIIAAAERIAADGYAEQDTPGEFRARAEAALFSALQTRQEAEILNGKALAATLDREEPTGGLETGLPLLDHPEPVLAPGRLVVLAGRPGIGKTALACAILARHALAKPPVPCFFASCEQTAREIAERILALHAGRTLYEVKRDPLPVAAIERLATSGLLLSEAGAPSLAAVLGQIRAARAGHGIRLAVVDHLGKVVGGRQESRTLEVGDVVRGLKGIAKDLRIPVLALCQLNRAVEGRNVKRPQLADLRESGEIEQEADAVVFLWTAEENPQRFAEVPMYVTLAKNRDGSPGEVKVSFDRPRLWFEAREDKGEMP